MKFDSSAMTNPSTWNASWAYDDKPTPNTIGAVVAHSSVDTASSPRMRCASVSDEIGSADLTVWWVRTKQRVGSQIAASLASVSS